jgi:hypothetical protein
MSSTPSGRDDPQMLESRKYHFIADGTMPVLDFKIKSGKLAGLEEPLTLELYHPMSGEVFEAKFGKGRIEVDRDGSITYFTRSVDRARFSIFLERNISITIDKSGAVEIRSPSKILSVERKKFEGENSSDVGSDSVILKLE